MVMRVELVCIHWGRYLLGTPILEDLEVLKAVARWYVGYVGLDVEMSKYLIQYPWLLSMKASLLSPNWVVEMQNSQLLRDVQHCRLLVVR